MTEKQTSYLRDPSADSRRSLFSVTFPETPPLQRNGHRIQVIEVGGIESPPVPLQQSSAPPRFPIDSASSHRVSWTDLRYTSDSDDGNFAARSSDESLYIDGVACENRGFLPKGRRHYNRVNNIRRFCHA